MSNKWWVLAWAVFAVTGLSWADPLSEPEQAGADASTPLSIEDWAMSPDARAELALAAQGTEAGFSEQPEDNETTPIEKTQTDGELGEINLNMLYDALKKDTTSHQVRMTLGDCVRMSLATNEDILISEFEPAKSQGDVISARGQFDPVFSGNATYQFAQQQASPTQILFGGISSIESWTTNTTTSIGGQLPLGTQYSLDLIVNKEESTFNSFIEEWSGGYQLSLTQPLFKGFGPSANLARIRTAKNTRLASESQVRLSVLTTVSQVVQAYWDLVGAIQNVRVREESLANAERLLDINKKRLKIGTAAAIEIVQSEAGVATRQGDLISARASVKDASDRLKLLLSMHREDVFLPEVIIPVNQPHMTDIELNEERSITLALQKRPEITSAELDIASAEIERKRAANDLLPQVDVKGSYFKGARNHYLSKVLESGFDTIDTTYSMGITASVPIGNRTARGAYERAKISVRQAERRMAKTKQDLMLNVRLALRGVNTSRVLVESNRQARILQEKNVEAEEKRLRLGVTTSFHVLEVQEDLTQAQTQEVQALVNFEKAIVDLRLAEGTLLEELGYSFELPEPPKDHVGFIRSVLPLPSKRFK